MKLTRALATSLGVTTLLAAAPATAAEVELTADLASAYVFRGATYNDGAVLQPGLSASGFKLGEFEIPLTFGIWGNVDLEEVEADVTDDDGNVVGTETVAESGKFSEIDLSVSLALPTVVEGLGWSVGFTDYLYPEAGGESDRELSLSFEIDTLLAPTLGLYYGVDGLIEKSTFVEGGVSHEFALSDEVSLSLGATVGYAIPDEGEEGFNNADLTASLSWKALTASVTYAAQLDDDVLVDVEDGGLYDVEVIGMLGLAQTF